MSSLSHQPPEAGWYRDPSDDSRQRWWDGKGWTARVKGAVEATPSQFAEGSGEGTPTQPSPAGSARLPIRRGANAFVIDFGDSPLVNALVANYARAHGGVWVGGTATITAATLEFRTNAMNRLLHGRRGDLSMDLEEIEDIAIQRALVSNIVAVRSRTAVVQLRCLSADEFAASLWDVATRARLATGCLAPLRPVRELSESRLASEVVEILKNLRF